MTFKQGLNFDIYVMDLLYEEVKPKTCKDLEELSEELHQRIEMAIQDYIYDSDKLNIEDYNALY